MDPTNSRWQVFWALHHAIAANGHSPTVRELAEVVGLATGTVHHHLKALKLDRGLAGLRARLARSPSFAFPPPSPLAYRQGSRVRR